MMKSIKKPVPLTQFLTHDKRSLVFAIFLLFYSLVAAAADVEAIKAKAEQGDAASQDALGLLYAGGDGVRQNLANATVWFKRAADQGYADAQFHLGLSYQLGRGVSKNITEALKWFELGAEQGQLDAQLSLGLVYANGRDVETDYAKANEWFRKAAVNGEISSSYYLGIAYQKGRGEAQDDVEAVKWFRKAAEGGHAQAQLALGVMYANGQGVPTDYNEAIRWLEKAAEQGLKNAQSTLNLIRASANKPVRKESSTTLPGRGRASDDNGVQTSMAEQGTRQPLNEEQKRKKEAIERISQRQAGNPGLSGRSGAASIEAENGSDKAHDPDSPGVSAEKQGDSFTYLAALLLLTLLFGVFVFYRSKQK